MGVDVCFVCLKTFESAQDELPENGGIALFTKLLKFAENHLQLSPVLRINGDEEVNNVLCEKCELSVINPICQVYLELLSAQLRLSWELERLGKLLKKSQGPTSDKWRVENSKTLTKRLGIGNVAQLEEFRRLLAQKCQLKRKEALPDAVVSRCHDDEQIDFIYEDLNDDDSGHLDLNPDFSDPLDLQSFTGNLENENDIKIEIEHGIKIEPITHYINPDLTLESDERGDVDNQQIFQTNKPNSTTSHSNQLPKPNHPITEDKRLENNDKICYFKCPKCDKVLTNKALYPAHNRYCHEPVKCNSCEKICNGTKNLSNHVYQNHRKVGSHPCQICSKVFETPVKLYVHRNKYHEKTKQKNCQYCNKPFYTNSALAEHVAARHRSEKHPCQHCSVTPFRTKEYLQNHIRKWHSELKNAVKHG